MNAFAYGLYLQLKLDMRNRASLVAYYLVPLIFYFLIGGIFTSVIPDTEQTLMATMTVFGVAMGALIGLPPLLIEIYATPIRQVYQANGVPLSLGLVLTNISAFVHLMILSLLIALTAGPVFGAALPSSFGLHLLKTALYLITSLAVADVIGLAVRDTGKATMASMLIFLPSIMLSGIMFDSAMLPTWMHKVGHIFPATDAFALMTHEGFPWQHTVPLLVILAVAVLLVVILMRQNRQA